MAPSLDRETGGEAIDHRLVALERDHLPRLAERGYVVWDSDAGTLDRGPRFGAVRALLELLATNADGIPDGGVADPQERE